MKEGLTGQKLLLAALAGKKTKRVPFWFMRQAGRYLPEYRQLREKAGGFLDMVYSPALAAEVTIQPLRRFGMDAAILFSDILVVPHALGCKVEFLEGEGPKLGRITVANLPFFNAPAFDARALPVYETVHRVRRMLKDEDLDHAALIGFAGSPWTVACYMAEGGGSRDFLETKRWAYSDPESFGQLIDTLVKATTYYLIRQAEAGAEALQLFDSWAGVLDEQLFRQWVIAPTREIVKNVRGEFPDIPIIGFPRGAGHFYRDYVQGTGVTAVGLDYTVPPKWAATALQPLVPVQGNLDPACLLAGGDAHLLAAESILANLGGAPFIFNLGHGMNKDTPVENVAGLCKLLQSWSS